MQSNIIQHPLSLTGFLPAKLQELRVSCSFILLKHDHVKLKFVTAMHAKHARYYGGIDMHVKQLHKLITFRH